MRVYLEEPILNVVESGRFRAFKFNFVLFAAKYLGRITRLFARSFVLLVVLFFNNET